MYIKGDIFINPSYPLYFGIGYKRFEERIKGICYNFFVKSISLQKVDVPKDTLGNIDLDVPTLEQFNALSSELKTKLEELKSLIDGDKDKLYETNYSKETKTLTIIQKPIDNGGEELPSES